MHAEINLTQLYQISTKQDLSYKQLNMNKNHKKKLKKLLKCEKKIYKLQSMDLLEERKKKITGLTY